MAGVNGGRAHKSGWQERWGAVSSRRSGAIKNAPRPGPAKNFFTNGYTSRGSISVFPLIWNSYLFLGLL